jgi:predicted 3-demethylubiquinone-9 3-methyltransferase (glyoxalase superfamily)
MPPIVTCLWFDTDGLAAAELYASVFPDGKIIGTSRYTEAGPGPAGSVMTVEFEIGGSRFLALNGGPQFTFTEAISFQVMCATQAEVDYYWARLSEGGQENVCGWLKDRFGVSWQIVPEVLPRLLVGEDRARAQRVTQAMFGMTKLDIAVLESA